MFIFIKNLVTVETAATRANRLRIQPLDARVGAMATKSFTMAVGFDRIGVR
jgi:hypothetical protein